MSDKKINLDKSVFVFEIDDVLYPKRDYLLQIYYLFANFVEYTEGRTRSKELLAFMKETFEAEGEEAVLSNTIRHFELNESYRENYERLEATAQLPLKLLLKEDIKTLLLSLFQRGKNVGVLTDGNPVEQLNKLKHIDWQELSEFLPLLKVFFIRELQFRNIRPEDFLATDYQVSVDDIELVSVDTSL